MTTTTLTAMVTDRRDKEIAELRKDLNFAQKSAIWFMTDADNAHKALRKIRAMAIERDDYDSRAIVRLCNRTLPKTNP